MQRGRKKSSKGGKGVSIVIKREGSVKGLKVCRAKRHDEVSKGARTVA